MRNPRKVAVGEGGAGADFAGVASDGPNAQALDFLGRQGARLILQHHGDVVTYRISQAAGPTQQFLPGFVVHQRGVGQGAGQQVEQFLVEHGLWFRVSKPGLSIAEVRPRTA